MILGLVIYNYTIVNVPFPLALYKKLLGEPIVLSDLKGLDDQIYSSIKQMLVYEEDNFQDVFPFTFVYEKDHYGLTVEVPLKPNGENIRITQENK